ncbi:MAG: tRNA glutamyl-Q(34) synthetase GluQRS [Nocardioides sp.]
MRSGNGRFAPSPTGDLHLGNLRTALLAYLFARGSGRGFLVRMEDLDAGRSVSGAAERQLTDLTALGLTWDSEVVHQSTRSALYEAALTELIAAGLTYECFCTRREIREAASAPHGGSARYPGRCRSLSPAALARRRAERPAAIRLRPKVPTVGFVDLVHGEVELPVDDIVLRRNDGAPAYHLAVVVDDGSQGIDQVVRGDDLLAATPAHLHLADLLNYSRPVYAHVPLAVNARGQRLAKRDGAVTLSRLEARGVGPGRVLSTLAYSLGMAGRDESVTITELLARFDPAAVPVEPWRAVHSE